LGQITNGLLSRLAATKATSLSVPGSAGGYYAVVQTGYGTMKGGSCIIMAALRQRHSESDTFQVGIQRDIYGGSSADIYVGEYDSNVSRMRVLTYIDTSPGTGSNNYILWIRYINTDGSCYFSEASISMINIGK